MKTTSRYVYSQDTRVYAREGYPGISYSDGEETEERLLRHVLSCADVSDASLELRDGITDWASEYHFSPLRTNLLRPFSFAGQRVLEFGPGCGAITRFLGESGAEVTSVEGSSRRAAIAAARCRDLSNVRIHCDNLIDFRGEFHFDSVTLIGVLEYSRLFVPGDDPVQNCLETARGHLTDDGSLYIAIENQLGLKYFNGCSEDHTGVRYFGINDRYSRHSPVTFGRKELIERLHAAGFGDVEFFFPFPDYKLPELILSERALTHPSLQISDLLCRVTSRDYSGPLLLSFNESLAWQTVARNGLIGEFANSFLVRASRKQGRKATNWHARTYSAGRLREFATENVIFEDQEKLKVDKRPLFPMKPQSSLFEHHTGMEDYVVGELYITSLQRITANNGGIPDISAWARSWLQFLQGRTNEDRMLPGEYVDCIPTNLVIDKARELHYIDAEWRSTTPIPFAWIAVRGLMIATSACPPSQSIGKMTNRDLIATILDQAGISLNDDDWTGVVKWENALRTTCYGALRTTTSFAEQLSRLYLASSTSLTWPEALEQANAHRSSLEVEISRIKNTLSWRMTKPFRFLYNTLRQLIHRWARPS